MVYFADKYIMGKREHRDINGIRTYSFSSWEDMLDHIDRNPSIYVAINAEKIVSASDKLKSLINNNTGYCDGFGAVKVLRRKGLTDTVRLPGCELWLHIIERHHSDWKFFIIGASPDTHRQTIEKLQKEYPDINIVGHRDGFIKTDADRNKLIEEVKEKQPQAVFVAMGTPRQEFLMEQLKDVCPGAVFVGLGGSFDVYTGNVKRAPKIWQNLGIEFMYRFVKNPSRWRRQFNYAIFTYRYLLNNL